LILSDFDNFVLVLPQKQAKIIKNSDRIQKSQLFSFDFWYLGDNNYFRSKFCNRRREAGAAQREIINGGQFSGVHSQF